MKNRLGFLIIIVFLIFWVGLIFFFSTRVPDSSYDQSNTALGVFYKLDEQVAFKDTTLYVKAKFFLQEIILQGRYNTAKGLMRKSAHIGIYLVLGFISCIFFYLHKKNYYWAFVMGITLPTGVAMIDEFVQIFVNRGASLRDVAIDSVGAFIGTIMALFLIVSYRFFERLKHT